MIDRKYNKFINDMFHECNNQKFLLYLKLVL